MFAAGKQIGAYTIDQPIARGRSGTVYKARAANDRAIALKVHDDADSAVAEIDCLRALDHPGVIRLVDQAELPDGATWLALPWVEGETLSHLLATTSPLPLDRTRHIVTQIADALDALHEAGFVHGDLAPSNVLIGADDRATIIDLATAKRIVDDTQPLDRTIGIQLDTTPRFTSPEVANGFAPEPASDTYALALIAYEALTGTSPFDEVATPIAMLSHHASSTPQAPSEHRPDLPGAVEQALLVGLDKDPASRQASASEFARQLTSDGPGHRAHNDKQRFLSGISVALLMALGALGITVLIIGLATDDTTDSAATSDLATQLASDAGDAASALCNLATNTGFEADGVPEHYYIGDTTNTTTLEAGGGVATTAALRIGANGAFGIYGEIVPIEADSTFILSAWLRQQGNPDLATLYVDYLDADFQELTNARADALIAGSRGSTDGERVLVFSEAPDGAAFAVPTFFKDGSGGSLFVDEVIFGAQDSCLNGLDQ